MLGNKLLKIKFHYFKQLKKNKMEKVNKQTEIKKLLNEGKSIKLIAEELKTNIAYVYKLKKQLNKLVEQNNEL